MPANGFERQPLGDRAYLAIKEMITTNKLAPGEPTPESALAAYLGISRSPVKAALTRLQGDGLIVGEAWKVPAVAPLDKPYVENVYQVMQALDAQCARQCVDRVPVEEIDAFAAELDAVREAMSNGLTSPVRDAHFHLNALLIKYCGNELLQSFEARLQDHLARIRNVTPQHDDDWLKLEYHFLVDELEALRDRDGERLATLSARLSEAFRKRILPRWEPPKTEHLLAGLLKEANR